MVKVQYFRLHPTEDVLMMSTVTFKESELGLAARVTVNVLELLCLTRVTRSTEEVSG